VHDVRAAREALTAVAELYAAAARAANGAATG